MTRSGNFSKSPRLFNGIAWGITILIVFGLLGFAVWKIFPLHVSAAPEPAPTRVGAGLPAALPTAVSLDPMSVQAIVRQIVLKTDITSSTNYQVTQFTVEQGDTVFSIAKDHAVKPESILWANYDTLKDNPESLRVGQVLNIPPTDGVYYKWQQGDTLDSIAKEFGTSVDDIMNWPGNNIDLTNPDIKPDTYVMVPGGHREVVTWYIPSVARGSATGTSNVGGSTCTGGPVGSGFIWPTGNHYLSGNDFSSFHLGIDIAAGFGAPVYAAAAGVVTIAQSGWNGGYGNLVMIDHGNGYITVYGHLSQYNVVPCQGVAAGTLIGLAGSTGNSTGPHLHFEIRLGNVNQNPWYLLPAP